MPKDYRTHQHETQEQIHVWHMNITGYIENQGMIETNRYQCMKVVNNVSTVLYIKLIVVMLYAETAA